MIEQPDLFAPFPASAGETAAGQQTTDAQSLRAGGGFFDPYRHPCMICGAAFAPFGRGWPHAPKFYCREHFEPGIGRNKDGEARAG